MTKLSNEEIVKRIKIRKVLKYLIIFFGLLTLGLAIYSLVTKFTPIPAFLAFMVEFLLTKYRNKLDPKLIKK